MKLLYNQMITAYRTAIVLFRWDCTTAAICVWPGVVLKEMLLQCQLCLEKIDAGEFCT